MKLKKRCIKHQKQEIEVKRQITACQSIIVSRYTLLTMIEIRLVSVYNYYIFSLFKLELFTT